LEAKVTGTPSLKECRAKGADSGSRIKQAATAFGGRKKSGHEGRRRRGRKELAELRLLRRLGGLG